ncbi:MAG: 50S ribosomal protein L18 [Gammaproteobacteria bacterium]|nr:50S ribosomal protein L18 [Gammaproteobacteria bacterium]MCH9744860.1 50S ribosomal protein L18 [Gammaproteobacteria bacterium]
MNKKKQARLRRAKKSRGKIEVLKKNRLSVYRSANHIYAQVLRPGDHKVLAQASSLDKELRGKVKHTGNVEAAKWVGQKVAERAKQAGIDEVAFDRSGFKFHGRIKALADAAREGGIVF